MNVLALPEASLTSRFQRSKALGITRIRLDWEWRRVESQPGIFDWSYFDRMAALATEHGVELLPVLHYAPDWARASVTAPGGFELAPHDSAFEAFATFVSACARRYGRHSAPRNIRPITAWQIWNEPNNTGFWGPVIEPERYARLLSTVSRALGKNRNTVTVVHAGLSLADADFLERAYQAVPDYGGSFDVMAVHPYLFDRELGVRQPEEIDRDLRDGSGFVGDRSKPNYLDKTFNIQLVMRREGGSKPIWITEIGFTVSKDWFGVTEAAQADLLNRSMSRIFDRLTDKPYGTGVRNFPVDVERIYLFALDDFIAPDGMGNFGMYRSDLTLRPSGTMIKQFCRV